MYRNCQEHFITSILIYILNYEISVDISNALPKEHAVPVVRWGAGYLSSPKMIFTKFSKFSESWQNKKWYGYQRYCPKGNMYNTRDSIKKYMTSVYVSIANRYLVRKI